MVSNRLKINNAYDIASETFSKKVAQKTDVKLLPEASKPLRASAGCAKHKQFAYVQHVEVIQLAQTRWIGSNYLRFKDFEVTRVAKISPRWTSIDKHTLSQTSTVLRPHVYPNLA